MNSLFRSYRLPVIAMLSLGLVLAAYVAQAEPSNPHAMSQAEALGQAFSQVAERVSPSVVSLRVEQEVEAPGPAAFGFPFSFGGPQMERGPQIRSGSGSGVVIRDDGYILTNNHVVANARRIKVVFQDGAEHDGEIVGTDPATDLAVVRVDADNLVAAQMADAEHARVGEWTIAIGAPFGLDYTVTAGVLSAKGRGGLGANAIEDYLQTDASINPGNSGGPLCNLRGAVLGINTMIVGRGTGIGFAIPADMATNVANQIISDGRVRRSWLGVGFQELTPDLAAHFGTEHRSGALIGHVVPDGPAAAAGLRAGDIIVTVGGEPIRESRDLLRRVIRAPVNEALAVTFLREGRQRQVEVTTAERPDDSQAAAEEEPERPNQGRAVLGLRLQRLTPELRQRLDAPEEAHLVISSVRQGSEAARAGLRRGDAILSADRRPVRNEGDLRKALRDGSALLQVARGARTTFVVLQRE